MCANGSRARALLPSCNNSDISDIIQIIGLLFQLYHIIAIIFHYVTDQNEAKNDDLFCYYFHYFSIMTLLYALYADKFARFLFEFHAHRFESLDLPFLPADRSDFDVHGALLDDKVHEYVILWTLICYTLNKVWYFWFHELLKHIISIIFIMFIISWKSEKDW